MQFISGEAKEVCPSSATTMKNDLAVNDFHCAGKIRVQGQCVQCECFFLHGDRAFHGQLVVLIMLGGNVKPSFKGSMEVMNALKSTG